MKTCTKCLKRKNETEFWLNKKLGRRIAWCNACNAEAKRAYKEANRQKLREADRLWKAKNPERAKAAQDRWRAKNPGLAAKRTAAWRAANREQALKAQRLSGRKLKDAAYAAYGGYRCACCGETIEAFLSIDHVNNDGAHHRRLVDRRKIYKWLARNGYPKDFQVLCMNCNFGKARNGGICPHKSSEGSTTIPSGSTP